MKKKSKQFLRNGVRQKMCYARQFSTQKNKQECVGTMERGKWEIKWTSIHASFFSSPLLSLSLFCSAQHMARFFKPTLENVF
jgi:hypothetical protein